MGKRKKKEKWTWVGTLCYTDKKVEIDVTIPWKNLDAFVRLLRKQRRTSNG